MEINLTRKRLIKIFGCDVFIFGIKRSTCKDCGNEVDIIFAEPKNNMEKKLAGFFCYICNKVNKETIQ